MIIVVYLLLAMASIIGSAGIDLAELSSRGVGDLFSEVRMINKAHAASPTFPYVNAVLYLRYYNGSSWSAWTTSDITIDPGNLVQAHWVSSTGWPGTSTTYCNGYGSGFATGGATTGVDADLYEPAEGAYNTYTLTCGGWDYPATHTDSSRVTVRAIPRGAVMGYKVNALNQAWNPAAVTVHGIGSYSQNPYSSGWIPAGWYTVSTTVPAGYEVSTSVNPGPASPWVPGASRVVYVPGGGIVHLWFKYTAIPPPVTNFYLRYYNGSTWSAWTLGDITVDSGDIVRAHWTSTNSTYCVGYGAGFDTGNAISGEDTTITEPAAGSSARYSATCVGAGGSHNDGSQVTVRNIPPPTVSLRGRKDGGAWTASSFTVDPVSEADLTWSSANATDCDATAGPGFATGNAVSGTDTSITEPAAGNSSTYTVRCTGPGGSASDSIVITTNVGGVPTLEADPDYVRAGDDTTLTWNTNRNDPATCSLTGPGLTMGTLSAETGSTDTEINGESTFTLTCPGGEATVTKTTVQILPTVQEI